LRLDPGYDWAWNTLNGWSLELKRPEAPLNLARELTELRGGEARSWLKLAGILSGQEHLDERLAALDRAIALDPRQFAPHDLKAQLLAEAGRFDEAAAVCAALAWGERPPTVLRGRAAWVEARRGDVKGALAQMREVLAEEPDYYWGWQSVAEWTCDGSRPEDYLEAAEALVRLAPHGAHAAVCRGRARLKSGDRGGAKDDFRRAFEKAPDYGSAAFQLFDLELEDKNLEAAARALEALKVHNGGWYVVAREVELAAAREDRRSASEALERLCTVTGGDAEALLRCADRAFEGAGWVRPAERIYAKAFKRNGVHPLVATLWIERWVARPHWRRILPQLGDLLARGEVGRMAAVAYFNFLGRTRALRRILACIRRHRQALRADTEIWGTVGYALLSVGQRRGVVTWLSDWPDRVEARPWMLLNLVYALRGLHRDGQANKVSHRALELQPDHCTPYHVLWLALDDLLDGDGRAARSRFDGLDPSTFEANKSYLYRLARLLLDLDEARPDVPREERRKASRELASIGRTLAFKVSTHAAVLHLYHRAVRSMAQDYGPVRGCVWSLLRWMNPPRKER